MVGESFTDMWVLSVYPCLSLILTVCPLEGRLKGLYKCGGVWVSVCRQGLAGVSTHKEPQWPGASRALTSCSRLLSLSVNR